MIVFPRDFRLQDNSTRVGISVDESGSVPHAHCEVFEVSAEGGVSDLLAGIVQGGIAGEGFKPRAIVPVDFDEARTSYSHAEELVVIVVGDVHEIPDSSFVSVADVSVQGVVVPVVLVDIGISPNDGKREIEVVIR